MTPYKAIVVSDLHLGTKDSKAEEFIDFIDKHPTDLLILNGDIIDGWALNRGSKWKKEHTKALGKILKLSNKIQVIWIRGNHDEFLTEFIGSHFGGIEFREDYKIEYAEHIEYDNWNRRCYYVFHGDLIDIFITKYTYLAKLGAVGYDFALWLNRIYNKYRKWRKLPYQSKIYTINKAVDSTVTKKIEVTTRAITNLKETVTELKETNETLKDSININVGRPYKLLPILSNSKDHR